MPSARELLQQADALMRRNRRRGRFKGGNDTSLSGADATLSDEVETLAGEDATLAGEGRGVPTLTDALAVDATPISLDTLIIDADPMSLDTLADLPVLTDAVVLADDGEIASLPARAQILEPLVPEEAAASAGRGPADDEFILEIPPAGDETAALPAATPAAAPAIAGANPDWEALADEIRSQVLQRLDLFTDSGLREQLGARLQPIVERASAELVDTINRQVGALIRSYIAEAIEREIDSWRSHHS
ncbi:MAG: hypothetical protein KGJ99_06090 [Betaproteobacteria bacterium]|nr:hypothetical protein [Betaproteobacteria bacterium]